MSPWHFGSTDSCYLGVQLVFSGDYHSPISPSSVRSNSAYLSGKTKHTHTHTHKGLLPAILIHPSMQHFPCSWRLTCQQNSSARLLWWSHCLCTLQTADLARQTQITDNGRCVFLPVWFFFLHVCQQKTGKGQLKEEWGKGSRSWSRIWCSNTGKRKEKQRLRSPVRIVLLRLQTNYNLIFFSETIFLRYLVWLRS